MLARLARVAGFSAAVIAAPFAVAAVTGAPRWACVLGAAVLAVVIYLWLPRLAHRAFRRGRFRRAAVLYHILRPLLPARAVRLSVDVSLAACVLGRRAWDQALARMDRIDAAALAEAPRAALLNNRAYALARAGRDPDRAVAASDEAIALRPDVVGFRHTRGVALLAAGHVDEAIRVLDDLWSELAGQDTPLLEAERCYDLAEAWDRKGEREYARDYLERSHRAAPGSYWAALAVERLRDARPAGESVPLAREHWESSGAASPG